MGSNKFGEDEASLRELYKFFSEVSHPNRDSIPYRGLGQGNKFVFGSVASPALVSLADYCIKHLELWMWFAPVIFYFYKEKLHSRDPLLFDRYNKVRNDSKTIIKWLIQQYNHVLEEYKAMPNFVPTSI